MAQLTLTDLIANGTMDGTVAATLSAIAEGRHSFLVAAVPRFAGKSTVTEAILGCRAPEVPRHDLSGDVEQMDSLRTGRLGGYVVVAEFAPHDRGSYIWGARARKAIETTSAGYSIAASLHAGSMEEAVAEVWDGIEAGDRLTSTFRYIVYIERFGEGDGDGANTFWRRLATVHELDGVAEGVPQARLLHRWVPDGDRYERVEEPRLLGADPARLTERAGRLTELAAAGKTSALELADALR